MIVTQKIQVESELIDKAFKYYSIVAILNGWKLAKKHLQLLAFTAIRGNITSPAAKQEFNKRFKCRSLNNLKSQLSRKGLLVKRDGMHRVNPKILPDFNSPLELQIRLNGQSKEVIDNKDSD